MGLVATWLTGCGLSHAIPNFTAAGIVTPASLADLDLAHYEALGVSSPEDRRKLFYLVQRIKLAVEKDRKENADNENVISLVEQVDALVQATTETKEGTNPARPMTSPSKENQSPFWGDVQAQSHGEPTNQERPSAGSSKGSPSKGANSPSRIPAPSSKRSPSKLRSPNSGIGGATSPGEITTSIKSPGSSVSPTKANEDDDGELDGSMEWEDAEDDECADDEASRTVITSSAAAACRRSKRLANIGNPAEPAAPVTKSVSPKKKHLSESKIAASGLKTPQTKSRAGSALPRPTARSARSQLQNPSKSMRTGKQLSTIPSDSIAPMSPLTSMPPPQLEPETVTNEEKRYGIPIKNTKSKSRRSIGGTVSDNSESDSSRSKRNRRTTMAGNLRRSSGSVSDSDSSVSERRRKSSGQVPTPKAKTFVSSARVSDIGTNKSPTRSISSTPSVNKAPKRTIHGGSETDSSWKAQIGALREEINLDHELFSDNMNREDEEDDLIQVIVRKRPFRDEKPSDIDVVHPLDYGYFGKILVYQPTTRVDLTKEINTNTFAFDGVFGEEYNNSQIYEQSVQNLIPVVLEGQHSTVFAFGCTGSGKTHTMMGSNFTGKKIVEEENMGLYYMAALDLFRYLEDSEYTHLSVGVSLFEIYGGKLYDLLNDRTAVKCLEDHKGKVQFPGLSEHQIQGPAGLIELIELGALSRSTGTTSRNADSSRSHAVLQMHLRKTVGRKPNVEHGRLTFIDLAGSERGADTANYSRATRLEGAEINTSLLALKEVIRARARGGSMTHVPFRGSKLTQVLKESFVGENSRCLMIACIAPDMDSCEQTLNTLRYADRVKERHSATGALPSKFKRGGRRTTNAIRKSVSSNSSIMSTSDQSAPSTRHTKPIGRLANSGVAEQDTFEDDLFSDYKSSMKESAAESETSLIPSVRPTAKKGSQTMKATNQNTLRHTVSEDSTDALLAAVLSDDTSALLSVSDNEREVIQTNSLLDELVATHESFLAAVLGMVQDEVNLLMKMNIDPAGLVAYGPQLQSMLQNQGSLISDLRECFQTYESIQTTELGGQLQKHRTVLTAILDIVKDELVLANELDGDGIEFDDMLELIETLQQQKLSQISELQLCFSSHNASSAPQTIESQGSAFLLSQSFRGQDDEKSEGSFEDLRF